MAILAAKAYREAMHQTAEMTILDIWYYRVDASEEVGLFDDYAQASAKQASKTVKKGVAQTAGYTLEKLTRVVVGQRLIQATSDIFLGWCTDSSGRHFYWRQFKDTKGSFGVTGFGPDGFATYLGVCAACLARAHARSGDPIAISSYLGTGTVFDDAIGELAKAYADQTERDYQALVEAVNKGKIVAQTGV